MSSEVPGPKIVNYQGNSKVNREAAAEPDKPARPKFKPIEGVNVVKTKKSVGSRIRESFGGENLKSVGLHLLVSVVVPKSKDLLMLLIEEGGHRAIYGDTGRRSTGVGPIVSNIVGSSRIRTTNYNNATASPIIGRVAAESPLSQRDRNMFDFSGLVIAERDQAEEVIENMYDAIQEFGTVSVADFYDFLEISGNGFTDANFGWDAKTFKTADVRKVREGWQLVLPQPIPIT